MPEKVSFSRHRLSIPLRANAAKRSASFYASMGGFNLDKEIIKCAADNTKDYQP